MQLDIKPGAYVVAVSGGVDSMVLLDLLVRVPGLELTVAHYDHGIRPDSSEDRRLVQSTAESLGLSFYYEEGRLGPGASEATARTVRYAFLERVRQQRGASAIITAHHQDDLLETAILNLIRGTRWRGLSSLASRPGLLRPLLHVPKADIRTYALEHDVAWREDSTNEDTTYLRNYVRHELLPRLGPTGRRKLLGVIKQGGQLQKELDEQFAVVLRAQPGPLEIDRQWFLQLPYAVASEVIAVWLRERGVRAFTMQTLERLVVGAKTLPPGSTIDVIDNKALLIHKHTLALITRER